VRFLQLLRHYRELQPINGVIIAVGLDTLAPQSAHAGLAEQREKSKSEAEKLCKWLDETNQELGLSCPVYLLVTGCDVLEGFTEFCGSFPESTLEQVFGYVHPLQSRPQDDTSSPPRFRLEPIHTALVERLRTLRSAIFYDERPTPLSRREKFSQPIYCFPEEFRLLQKPLSTFVETLFDGHPAQAFYFRGIFFCSARQQGSAFSHIRQHLGFDPQSQCDKLTSQPYFLHDLFESILPHD
jgi:type VI secretion system protein ImpL